MIKAIETSYKGYRFRSRLEARWAVYFDAVGLRWEYEKEGFELPGGERYLPDFWFPDVKRWAEVKPEQFTKEEIWRCVELVEDSGYSCVLLDGPPDLKAYWEVDEWCADQACCDLDDLYPDLERLWGHGWHTSKCHVLPWFVGLMCCGLPSPSSLTEQQNAILTQAVIAARSARFEYLR